jgi:LAO/AO transport system kinase
MSGVPILKTTATTGEGLGELAAAVGEIGRKRLEAGVTVRRRRRARYLIARAAAELVAQRVKESGAAGLDVLADTVLAGKALPRDAAATFLDDPFA